MSQEDKENIHIEIKDEEAVAKAKELAKQLEAEKQALREANENLEDLRNKMGIIAEKELDKKREAVTEKAKAILKDPESVKEITDKLTTLEGIAAMEFTMDTLEKQMQKAEELKKLQKAEELKKFVPTGTSRCDTPQQMGVQSGDQNWLTRKYDSYEQMTQTLREVSHDMSDPQDAQKASEILNQLINKYAKGQKTNRSENVYCPDDQVTKSDKVPQVDYSGEGSEPYSEIEAFGIKKNPHGYAKRNKNMIVAQVGQEEKKKKKELGEK